MWSPTLPTGAAPVYERLTAALAADIAAGVLKAGDRLPPHRDLAFRLGVGVGTVTRAYAEAERKGLLAGHVGRGSFVAATPVDGARPVDGPIDFARSLPPLAPARQHLAAAMNRLARRPELADRLGYAPPGGFPVDLAVGAAWLRQVHDWPGLQASRLVSCSGAQQAVAVALGLACHPGDAVIAEAATFAGVKSLAGHMDYRLAPAAMDAEGLTPDGLDRAAAESGAKAAYVLPTQNPTGRVMGEARRRQIVAVARRRDLILVEDDLFGAYAGGFDLPPRTPLAALAPERTLFASALSKSVAPGLRVGWLVLPDAGDWLGRALSVLHAIALGGPTFGGLIATGWIEDGIAEAILKANREELRRRTDLALDILGEAAERPAMAGSPHVWLPMNELEAERVAGRALRSGVELTPPDGPILDRAAMAGLRLCLGGAADLLTLERGLRAVKTALSPGAAANRTLI